MQASLASKRTQVPEVAAAESLRQSLDWLLANVQASWLPEPQPVFHALASCILSQRVRFEQGRRIRQFLYSKWASNEITCDRVEALSTEDWDHLLVLQVNPVQRTLLLAVAQLYRTDPNGPLFRHPGMEYASFRVTYPNLKGIGPWTCQAVRIYARLADDVLIDGDKYVDTHLQKLIPVSTGSNTTPRTRAKLLAECTRNIPMQHTRISLILWRLKKESIAKVLLRSETLSSHDFHPVHVIE